MGNKKIATAGEEEKVKKVTEPVTPVEGEPVTPEVAAPKSSSKKHFDLLLPLIRGYFNGLFLSLFRPKFSNPKIYSLQQAMMRNYKKYLNLNTENKF